ncbi:MAG: hypothetical protein VKO65_00940 [Cyanobacteriota bacterium]|nr:hypothetical protein [Cyanobacteriota bacterium]
MTTDALTPFPLSWLRAAWRRSAPAAAQGAAQLLGSVALGLCHAAAVGAATPASADLSGLYAGAYQCAGGVIGATLDLQVRQGRAQGALAFYPLSFNPQAPSGSFRMSGTVRDGALSLTPGAWIQEPASPYGAAGIEAVMTPERIVGSPTGPKHWGCGLIELRRVPPLR